VVRLVGMSGVMGYGYHAAVEKMTRFQNQLHACPREFRAAANADA
jgi:hypothetical protein